MAAKAPVIDDAAIEQLRFGFRGDLLRPSDRAYKEAKRVFNGMHASKRPALIARCTGTSDVVAALAFARGRPELPLSVRGGGHSVAGFSTNNGGIVIDLSRMRGVRVDAAGQTARAQGGATWGDYDRETQAFGLASPGGLVSTTGIAGLTLGGGLGMLSGKYGLACDSLIGADVVTADGRAITVDENTNSDLLWGLRGGGGNFGIVTSFEYKLYPVGQITMGLFFYPVEQAAELLTFYREFAAEAPEELLAIVNFVTIPEEPPMPIFPQEILGKRVCGILGGWCGPVDDGEKAWAPVRGFSKPLFEIVLPMPYTMAQSIQDTGEPWGNLYYWKHAYAQQLSDELIGVLADHGPKSPSPHTSIVIGRVGGAIARGSEDEGAFPLRDAGVVVQMDSQWTDRKMSKEQMAWAKALAKAVEPHALDRGYINFIGDEGKARIRRAYGKERYRKLVELKDRYDPTNVFRLNQNIEPSGA